MKITRERVCDVCESADGVCRYRITKLEGSAQHTVTSDLCTEHAEGVQLAIDAAPVPRRGRKTAKPVVSLDSIAAKKTSAKRAARKAPAKKPGPSKRS